MNVTEPGIDTAEFSIGSEVACSDGVCGDLKRVVLNPLTRELTDLVVEPRHRPGAGHLVPIDLVASTGKQIRLSCTTSEFQALEDAEETRFLSRALGQWDYRQDQMLFLPYYGLGMGGMGMGGMGMGGGMGMAAGARASTDHRVPVGEVEVLRGEHVHATDGPIGRVQGLVIDTRDHHVTHVLLEEGHLWGHKRVAIPISAVTDVKDGVRINLSKDDVRDLPSVKLDHHE